jgi:uncharacterized membrane protein YbaN (DUF454 family)
MNNKPLLQKILHLTIGITLVIVGIFGLVLPVINGFLTLLLGFIVISFQSTYIEKQLLTLSQKNKHVAYWYTKLLTKMRNVFGIHRNE